MQRDSNKIPGRVQACNAQILLFSQCDPDAEQKNGGLMWIENCKYAVINGMP